MTNQISSNLPSSTNTCKPCKTNSANQLSSHSEITKAIQELRKNVSHSDTAKSIRELLNSSQKNVSKVVLSTLIEAEINRLNQQPDANRATHIRELLSITCDTLHPPDLIRFVENEIKTLCNKDNILEIFYLINCVLSGLLEPSLKNIDTLNLRIENIFSISENACDYLLNFDIG